MPELPEVQTTVSFLQEKIAGQKITKIWSDNKKAVKKPLSFKVFKKDLVGSRIEALSRKAKYIIFHLSASKTLIIHQRMTGHLLLGRWRQEGEGSEWKPEFPEAMQDPYNGYLHFIFWLDSEKMLALSDLRKFATIRLYKKSIPQDPTKVTGIEKLDELGPDPLEENLDYEEFVELFSSKRSAIKPALLDQSVVSGIGNIYSDEILWQARVNPHRKVSALSAEDFKRIYNALFLVLEKALSLGGTSIVDYRKPDGEKAGYAEVRKVYKREGEACPRCGAKIKRDKISGRSAHFCPQCQKITGEID